VPQTAAPQGVVSVAMRPLGVFGRVKKM
jgi:hypothetical protein